MRGIRTFFSTYERHISAGAILLAFIVDSLTFVRVDFYLTNVLLIAYLSVVALGILAINMREEGGLAWLHEGAYRWLFIAVQFSYGGLFGRFLIYYSRSGSLYASWPFLLLLLVLLIGNEFAKKYYTRLVLQISFFFLALFSYLIFLIPLIVNRIGSGIFVLSGAVSLLLIMLFLRVLSRFIPRVVSRQRFAIMTSVVSIFVALNALYFTNSIPPIPLSLREAGVYHSVVRTESGYRVMREEGSFYDYFKRYTTIHLRPGQPAYVFSSVFAPADFDTEIAHTWQKYDFEKEEWVDSATIPFSIVGGADRGYRGYSLKSQVPPGLWRVNIETRQGQTIGRVEFMVEKAEHELPLVSEFI